ncbi:hypothetical protein K4A83_11730 [Spirulina subsalsa FACHB-351]|uniref:Uncharacterized protein n=1 Tax=Spirulina subsalsa FACHB-351 TaxID=234711 RepID=A0ABT3L605_9CYAN|nr:tyrosine-protein kinase domain-containing protein [Spirulina subsalsa]MCW6036928.1 hypothetical protein [Spirulina subsalsa FACHB-351]
MSSPLVKRFLVSLGKNKWIGLAVSIIVAGGASVVAMLPPPAPPPTRYKAIGQLAFSSPPPTATETGKVLQEQGRALDRPTLLSEPVLQGLVETVDLPNPVESIKRINLQLPKEGEPPLIRLEYVDTNEERAARTLEVLMEKMIEHSRMLNTSRLRSQIEALEKRVEEAKADLAEAEQEFYRFMTREATGLVAAQDGTLFMAISAGQQQQRELRLQLDTVNAQIQSLSTQLSLTPEEAFVASALSADPIIASLRTQILQAETQMQMLANDLRPEHPTMRELNKQLAAYNELLTERADEVIGSDNVFDARPREIRRSSSLDPTRQQLAAQIGQLRTQKEAIEQQIRTVRHTEEELRLAYERFPTKQLEQARLQQQVAIRKQFHDTMQGALVDAQSAEAETISSLSLALPPRLEKVEELDSSPPHPVVIIAAGYIGALVAGAVVILGMSFLDPKVYTAKELQDILSERDVAVLGELPFLVEGSGGELPLLLGVNAPYLDLYELFRSNIRRLSPKSTKVILVTSVSEGEGKSVVAYNLAIASAHAGKRTLLVEGDLRSPSNAQAVKLAVDHDAQAEPLSYYGSRNDSVRLVPDVMNLYISPSAGPQRKAAAIVESSELKSLLEDARQRFDLVIVDSPALTTCNDALLLQPQTDGMILVTCVGVSQAKILGAMLDEMTEAEMPIIGGAINAVPLPVPNLYAKASAFSSAPSREALGSEGTLVPMGQDKEEPEELIGTGR